MSKMIQHTHYDRKLRKYIRTMVPQSNEHKERSKSISKALSNFKTPSESQKRDFQRKTGRGYNE